MSYLMAVLALAILILVHELGHFIAAKLCGVYVERFSIGFGKVLLSKKIGDTEYCISAIPLGGYVKLHRMTEDEDIPEDDEEAMKVVMRKEDQAFYNKPYHKKIIIIVAGVTFNMIFAVLLLGAIYLTGYQAYSPLVGSVDEAGPAREAGFEPGDRILSIDGKLVRSWDGFFFDADELSKEASETVVVVNRDGATVGLPFRLEQMTYQDMFGEEQQAVNLGMGVLVSPVIGDVNIGYPAEAAGLQKDDLVLSINGAAVKEWSDIGAFVQSQPEGAIDFEVSRNGKVMNFEVTPTESDGRRIVGILASAGDVMLRENPVTAIKLGFQRTIDTTVLICKSLLKLATGKISKDNVGGPILIVQEASKSAKDGLERYLAFMAVISINLAILNMLPVPILDGGHVVVYTIERIRRKPISVAMRESGQKVGFALLALLMIFAFYNDIVRFIK
jgi:regulator of sigma E protease